MSEGGSTRFTKGKSGNPKGRPRKKKEPSASAFDVILDQTFTVRDGDGTRELTAEEALQLRTYQAALKGSRVAQRTILKMIAKREAWRAQHAPVLPPIKRRTEKRDRHDHALQAMLILGIASAERKGNFESPLLEPWAVKAALERLRGRKINRVEAAMIRVSTKDCTSLNLNAYRDDVSN